MATRFARLIVRTAITHKTESKFPLASPVERKIRKNAAKAAALGPTDMNAVTAVGAPSYTSGVHM